MFAGGSLAQTIFTQLGRRYDVLMVYDEEQSNKILAVSLQGVLDILEEKGSVSNETHIAARQELRS